MLSGPHQKFAEGIALGLSAAEAYKAAYPKASADNARKNAPRLTTNDDIVAEVTRIRRAAEVLPGGAVLTLAMKRHFLYNVVMTPIGKVTENSYLCQEMTRTRRVVGRGDNAEEWEVEKIKIADKLAAIRIDNELSGDNAPVKVTGTLTIEQLFPGSSFLPESIGAEE